ncbi:hypothetical protein ABK040_005555 [Willaertia magna]
MQRKQEKHHAEDDEITLEYVSDDESNNMEKDQQQLLLMEPIENEKDSFKKKQDSLMMKSKLIVNERIKEQRLVERKRDLLREKLKMVETIKERSNDRSNEGITVMKSEKNNGCVIL